MLSFVAKMLMSSLRNAIRSTVGMAVAWQQWLLIDAAERASGNASGRVRTKTSSVSEMLALAQASDHGV